MDGQVCGQADRSESGAQHPFVCSSHTMQGNLGQGYRQMGSQEGGAGHGSVTQGWRGVEIRFEFFVLPSVSLQFAESVGETG